MWNTSMPCTTKFTLLAVANLIVQGIEAFHIYDFTDEQKDWTLTAINFAGLGVIWLTYKLSKKRVPEA